MTDDTIDKFMTACPHCIEPSQSLKQAQAKMREHHIRHLPVRRATKLVGLLSDRDIDFSLKFLKETEPVSEVMISDPYCVISTDQISNVATNMVERGIGSTVVVNKQDEVLGIFTQVDALKVIASLTQAT